jgi:hypothetical protein
MPDIHLPEALFARLQAIATPFVDTPVTVIERLLREYEANHLIAKPIVRNVSQEHILNPEKPGSLAHTFITWARIGDTEVDNPNWNKLVHVVHQVAVRRGATVDTVIKHTGSSVLRGEHSKYGFVYLPDVGISVQGSSADAAWRGVQRLAMALNIPFDVSFEWRQKDGAAHPGERGRLFWQPKESA